MHRADIWDEIFTPGQITIHELVEKTRKYDGAVLILADDDQIIRESVKYSEGESSGREEVRTIPRDNVLVEAGMFMGVLGTETVALCEVPGVWRTSDFSGITRVEYDIKNRERMKESFRKWLQKGVVAGRRFDTSMKSRNEAEKEFNFEDMFGINDQCYKDITRVRIMNLASNILLNPQDAIQEHYRYQKISLALALEIVLKEKNAQVDLILLEPNQANLKDVESKISNSRYENKSKVVITAWEALLKKVKEKGSVYQESFKEPSRFRYYAMKTSMPIGIINVEFKEHKERNFVHVDLYIAALDTENNRRVINIWESQDLDNYRFFVRNFDDIKKDKSLCKMNPGRKYLGMKKK